MVTVVVALNKSEFRITRKQNFRIEIYMSLIGFVLVLELFFLRSHATYPCSLLSDCKAKASGSEFNEGYILTVKFLLFRNIDIRNSLKQ